MSETWSEQNQKYLVACIDEIKALLKAHNARLRGEKVEPPKIAVPPETAEGAPPALESICGIFGLSPFEKHILVLCAGVELDSEVARLCAQASGNLDAAYPTFGLAMAALPQAHWSALSPASPLRRFKLVEVAGGASSMPVAARPIYVVERVLHYLTGVFYFDTQLRGLLKLVQESEVSADSHLAICREIGLVWKNAGGKLPIIQLWGVDESGKVAIAKKACAESGLELWFLFAELIPQKTEELDFLVLLWAREAALLGAGLYVSAEDVEPATQKLVTRFVEVVSGPVFLGTRDRWPLVADSSVSVEVKKPLRSEQRQLWNLSLGDAYVGLEDAVLAVVGQFDLNASAIRAAAREAQLTSTGATDLPEALWQAACAASRPRVLELAQQIEPKATAAQLVLPEGEKQLLSEVAVHVRQRFKVYAEWGFEGASSRGLGITALFSGPSGTGKTMAAEVIANELKLDLFRIDLSSVVSKYIGETEKNLRKLFDAAEDGGAILFFDEADALFGKRSEVRDSHDRYANIEVNYLLQRMESYRGLAILATNMKSALDPAFTRRLRFIVNFPFPDEKSRMEIWRHIFPTQTPTSGLDLARLAKLNIAGGNIRNIALYGAFLAANEGVPVGMRHIKRAAEVEYAKLERPLTQVEAGGW